MKFWPTKTPKQYGIPPTIPQPKPRRAAAKVWKETVAGTPLWIASYRTKYGPSVKGFRTHTQAIAYADRVARR